VIKAPIPANEAERLEALRDLDILDTRPEERFDRLTRVARRLFGVPIALVSLVDADRQWFKSRQGLDATETPRDISFCGHAIAGEDVLVVRDALADDRFQDNPLVREEPKIRFYAGCPVRAKNGSPLGTLCLVDRRPRELGREELALLRDLAAMVEQELESGRIATTDELTGISNRRGFNLAASPTLALCDRLNAPATLLFFDLDDFKEINDRFGHAQGDRALADFAGALVATFRDADAVARIGGDEFCVLCAGVAETMSAPLRRLEERLRALEGRPYRLGFSVGKVAFDASRHRSVEAVLAEADRLMYQQKRARKG
jgi:diguanylate cyclase (GGDEF)-like protein